MFETLKSTEELCKEFKRKALEFFNTHPDEKMIIKIEQLEEFFSYTASKTYYIPRKIKDYLKSIDVFLNRKRSHNIVEVIIK